MNSLSDRIPPEQCISAFDPGASVGRCHWERPYSVRLQMARKGVELIDTTDGSKTIWGSLPAAQTCTILNKRQSLGSGKAKRHCQGVRTFTPPVLRFTNVLHPTGTEIRPICADWHLWISPRDSSLVKRNSHNLYKSSNVLRNILFR